MIALYWIQFFSRYSIAAVLHFAGLKAVGESVQKPLAYYENNVSGSVVLFQAMAAAGVFNLVFSSSATVYGEPKQMPISEECPTGVPTNPYGRSKLMVEEILRDLSIWSHDGVLPCCVTLTRWVHMRSGLIGEDPNGIPNNLLPYISQVAVGKLQQLSVYGDDYPTIDGTGVRDYIHVVDLADGHLKALDAIAKSQGVHIWNLGTGQGYSVLQMIAAFEQAAKVNVPYKIVERRSGDIAECWADPSKAATELGWKALHNLDDMMRDTWCWQQSNPDGFKS